MKVDGLNMVR